MLGRIFKYSVKNSLRNKFLSVSSILVLTLLMFFVNILFVVEDVSVTIINSINSKLTISLYINENYTKTSLEITDLREEITRINSEIGIEYKTKDDILNDMRAKEPDLVSILEKSNPLPDTIVLSNIAISDYKRVNDLITSRLYLLSNDETQEDYFANYTTQYKKIEDVTAILGILQTWLNIVILIFVVSIAVIIYSVIWNFIYYYRDEIYITQLVWWSNVFIYWPFVLQWMMYSLVAFGLNTWIFLLLLRYLNTAFWDMYTFAISTNLIIIMLVVFLVVWWISGYLSSRKYLKRIN